MNKEELLAALQTALAEKNQSKLEELANEAIVAFSEDAFGYAYLAEAFLLQNPAQFHQAEVNIATAIKHDSDNANYLLKFGDIKEKQGLFEDARILYLKTLQKEPNNIGALAGIGMYDLRVAKLYNQALESLQKVATADATYPNIHLYLAEAYMHLEQTEKALAEIEKAGSEDFNEAKVLLHIEILDKNNQKKESLMMYKELLTARPEVGAFRFEYSYALFGLKQYKEVINQTEKGLALMGDSYTPDAFVYTPYIESLLKKGENEKVIAILDTYIATTADDLNLYDYRATAKLNNKDLTGAIEDLKKAQSLLKSEVPIMLYDIKIGVALAQVGKLEEASQIFKEVNKEDALYGLYCQGVLLHAKGEMQKAYVKLKEAKKKKIKEAAQYIEAHFDVYLKEIKDQLLAEHEQEFVNNAASAQPQQIFGGFYTFEVLESEKLKKAPKQVIDFINNSMKNDAILFTEKGVMLVNEKSGGGLTYKILKEGSNSVQLEFAPLDGDTPYPILIKAQGKKLKMSIEKDKTIVFEKREQTRIPSNTKLLIKDLFKKENLEYLGEGSNEIIQAVFG